MSSFEFTIGYQDALYGKENDTNFFKNDIQKLEYVAGGMEGQRQRIHLLAKYTEDKIKELHASLKSLMGFPVYPNRRRLLMLFRESQLAGLITLEEQQALIIQIDLIK